MRMFFVAGLVGALLTACGGSAPLPPGDLSLEPAEPFASAASGGRPLLSCGTQPFDPSMLLGAGMSADTHPASATLATVLAEGGADGLDRLPRTGWTLVAATTTRADFMAAVDDGWAFASFVPGATGWVADAWGPCSLEVIVPGLNVAEWTLDPHEPLPDSEATRFSALVTERDCASGQPMGGRLRRPSIWFTEAGIVVLFTVEPQRGGQDCPGNPSTRAVVELSEPLGDRHLYDGSVFPYEPEL
jgi:hypothetical protein